MRIIGLDYGTHNIGVAISDPFGSFAQPLEIIRRKPEDGLKKSLGRIAELVEYYSPDLIVVGLPLVMYGKLNDWGREVIAFIRKIEKRYKIPVVAFDERRSSANAERILMQMDYHAARRKKEIDKMAAAVILQGYIDTPERLRPKPGEINTEGEN